MRELLIIITEALVNAGATPAHRRPNQAWYFHPFNKPTTKDTFIIWLNAPTITLTCSFYNQRIATVSITEDDFLDQIVNHFNRFEGRDLSGDQWAKWREAGHSDGRICPIIAS